MSFSPLTFERYSRTSRQALCHLPAAAALRFWNGIAVLPCFSASGKVPVTRCGLPLRGTYAVYVQFPLRLSHAHARLRPRKHFKRFHQSRQGGRIPTRSFQQALSFSVRRSAYSHIIRERPGHWQERVDSDHRIAESKSAAFTTWLRSCMLPCCVASRPPPLPLEQSHQGHCGTRDGAGAGA